FPTVRKSRRGHPRTPTERAREGNRRPRPGCRDRNPRGDLVRRARLVARIERGADGPRGELQERSARPDALLALRDAEGGHHPDDDHVHRRGDRPRRLRAVERPPAHARTPGAGDGADLRHDRDGADLSRSDPTARRNVDVQLPGAERHGQWHEDRDDSRAWDDLDLAGGDANTDPVSHAEAHPEADAEAHPEADAEAHPGPDAPADARPNPRGHARPDRGTAPDPEPAVGIAERAALVDRAERLAVEPDLVRRLRTRRAEPTRPHPPGRRPPARARARGGGARAD